MEIILDIYQTVASRLSAILASLMLLSSALIPVSVSAATAATTMSVTMTITAGAR